MSAIANDANKTVGKPARRRPNKSVGDLAKPPVSGGTAASTSVLSSPTEATHNGTPNEGTSESGKPEKVERDSIKDISKRLKKQAKKLESIRRSEDKMNDPTRLITVDERRKLNEKPITEAVHKELQEIHENLSALAEAEEKALDERLDEQKRFYEDKLAKDVKEAKEETTKQIRDEMVNVGNEKVNTLLKFLRLAGYRRSVKSDNVQEDEAIEQVLVLVYSGDNSAMEACMKLADGSTDPVGEEHTISFARVKELAHDLRLDDDEDIQDGAADSGFVGGVPVEASPEEVPASVECTSPPTLVNGAGPEAADSSPTVAATTEEASPLADTMELINGWVDVQPESPVAEEGKALTESTGNGQPIAEVEETGELEESKIRDFERRRGGVRGRFRNGSGYRGGRGRGFRGDRGGGEHRGGEYRGGEYRGGEYRGGEHRGGEYRGGEYRGGEHRGGEHRGGEHRGGDRSGGDRSGGDRSGEHRGGEHRGEHRGEYRGGEHRGEHPRGEHRGGEHRGEYRGRGRYQPRRGDFRSKGDNQQAPPATASS